MRRVLLVTLFLLAVSRPAPAAIDMTGTWTFGGSIVFGASTWGVTQVGSMITLCIPGVGSLPATLDTNTGELTVDFSGLPPGAFIPVPGGVACQLSWTATVAADGNSLVGNERYGVQCIPPPFSCTPGCLGLTDHAVTGTRTAAIPVSCGCGDGIVVAGEACDDGPNSLCCQNCTTVSPPTVACASDGNPCTDDLCNGTGACGHTSNTATCGSQCQPGTCSGGGCVLGTPSISGTACTADPFACTVDACDGSGQCLATYACGPCETCPLSTGVCTPIGASGCHPMARAQLDLRLGPTPERDRVRWRFKMPNGQGSFGDPTASTSYSLCVFRSSAPGVTNPLLRATAPAGGLCGTKPCWSVAAGGLSYKDPDQTPDGLRSLRSRGGIGQVLNWTAKGDGPALLLPSVLPTGETISAALVAHDGDVFRACWGGTFPTLTKSTPTRLQAKQ